MSKTEFDLLDGLCTLSDVARDLEHEVRKPLLDASQNLRNLQTVIRNLGQAKAAKALHCPEEYASQWKNYLQNQEKHLERRAVRYLCWQPDIATSQRFQYYLDQNNVDLNARALQGLVRCCHAQWSSEFARSQAITRVRDRLENYKGTNRVLSQWRENSNTILGPTGAEEVGAEMVEKVQRIKAHCESWGIPDETCAYVQAAVRHATVICRDEIDRTQAMRQYLLGELLLWDGWAPDIFKQEVSKVILHPATTRVADVRESVTRFVLNDSRLGDPRLPHNRLNWATMGEAERLFVEWLSQEDIVFFFESVLPPGKDPHGRKHFWLDYVSRVVRSRPLLTRDDRYRLEATLKQKGKQLTHYGSMSDRTFAKTSAFLLDFGELLALEFSAVNNACYLYRKANVVHVVPDFWTLQPFDPYRLKNRGLCFDRISHTRGWEEKLRQILSQFGIRRGYHR